MLLVEQLVNGVVLGATYSLIALAFTLVLGVLGQLNMAVGETLMVSGFAGLVLMTESHLPFGVALLGAMAVGAAVSLVIYVVSFKWVSSTYYTSSVLSTLGVGVILTATATELFGSETKSFPDVVPNRQLGVGELTISLPQLLVLGVSLLVMAILYFIVRRTRLGLALRAVSERPNMAALLGVPVQRVVMLTFALSGVILGAAGVLTGLTFHTISPFLGLDATLKGLAVMVLGGLGNVVGAMSAGFMIGIIEIFSVSYVSADFRNAFAFIVLIAVLTLRPQGLFGNHALEGERA